MKVSVLEILKTSGNDLHGLIAEEVDVSVSSTPSTTSLPSSWTPSPIEEQPLPAESSDQVNFLSLE